MGEEKDKNPKNKKGINKKGALLPLSSKIPS